MLYAVKFVPGPAPGRLQLNGRVCTLPTRVAPLWDTVFPHPQDTWKTGTTSVWELSKTGGEFGVGAWPG